MRISNITVEKYLKSIKQRAVDLTKYKKPLREQSISHRQVSLITGLSRPTITNILNGKEKTTPLKSNHIAREIESLLNLLK